MKKLFTQLRRTVLTGLALAASIAVSHAQVLTTTYTNDFDTGGSTTNFEGSGSVSSWIYWYGAGYNNTQMSNDVSLDVNNNTNSGSLLVGAPFATYDQCVFFGTFQNAGGYSGGVTANILLYTNITFYIRMAPGTPPRVTGGTNTDFGAIGVGISTPGNGFEQFGGSVTIPLAASNSWVFMTVPVNYTVSTTTAKGIVFDYNSYGGYPLFPVSFNIDSLQFNITPGPPPPPPTMSAPFAAISGLNTIDADQGNSGQQYNRYQICTVASTGYSFINQPSVTYTWNIKSFPLGTGGGGFQQHFFIVGNYAPGQYDQAADYNLPDVLWFTVQQNDVLATNDGVVYDSAGTANFNFRLKTNEASGNSMLFNTTSPTDTVNNPNGWPIEPIATLAAPSGAEGTWSVTIANNTNITVSGPGGVSTNFSITAAQAALFADPVSLILGGQPNNTNAYGRGVVYGSFTASGAQPINDNFLTDTTLNTTIWKNLSNDTNGLYLVPATSAYWVGWSLPDAGFSLQSKANLGVSGGWTLSTAPIIRVNAQDRALIDSSALPSATQGYFQLIQYQASQLQVLLGGQTNAPGTLSGYTGTATNVSATADNGQVTVTVNAVDPTFHIVAGDSDTVAVTSSDVSNGTNPLPAPLVNGTLTTAVLIGSGPGNYTVMAVDQSAPPLASGTSTSVTITP
jgi:hypothetical protein